MKAEELRALQAPVKARYRENPAAAQLTMKARGTLDAAGITCKVQSAHKPVEAGLHPGAGGDGRSACAGDMLLEALVGCAGVTLRAVATALEIPLRGGTITAEGDLDFRGTLGVSKEVPIGFKAVRLEVRHFQAVVVLRQLQREPAELADLRQGFLLGVGLLGGVGGEDAVGQKQQGGGDEKFVHENSLPVL